LSGTGQRNRALFARQCKHDGGAVKERSAEVALQRFGLGARPGEIAAAARDPRGYLMAQIERADAATVKADLPSSDKAVQRYMALREQSARTIEVSTKSRRTTEALAMQQGLPREEAKTGMPQPTSPDEAPRRAILIPEMAARFNQAFTTPHGLAERLALFWINHFAISVRKGGVAQPLNGAFEREAIRPFVFGRFADMLAEVESHPAMLFYLDNQQSMGPNSESGLSRKRAHNENLAREILELHTLGVAGGYTQQDVTNFALVITGWSFVRANLPEGGLFDFVQAMHEPGPKTVLGRVYPQGGERQGRAVLADLAVHPSTAQFIARKLAQHFVADDPPPSLVSGLARTFEDTRGDLKAVTLALIEADESWQAPLAKIRTPQEFIIATMRALGAQPEPGPIQYWANALGQPVMAPPSPKGFPDDAASWISPDAIKARLDWATAQAGRFGPRSDPPALARNILGRLLTDETESAIARAESRQQAMALLLMSPEFQRR
jgi:uncharacterized protein (DUF1800 family)